MYRPWLCPGHFLERGKTPMSGEAVAIAFGAALGGALFGILTGIVFHRILGAYIEGGIGAYGCVVVGGLFLVLAGSVVVFHSWPLLVLMGLLVALTPLLRRRVEKLEDRRYYDERIGQCIEALQADPRNLAARGRLADCLHKEGRLDEAIEQYTDLVRISPSSREEAYRLKQLIQERDECRDPLITCPKCGRKNPKSRLHCAGCEASLAPGDRLKQWLEGVSGKQFVRLASIAAGCVVLILFLGSLLSPTARLVAILITLAILGIAFVVNTYMN
jgi:hypothetical protein